jgi:hypothetical protein
MRAALAETPEFAEMSAAPMSPLLNLRTNSTTPVALDAPTVDMSDTKPADIASLPSVLRPDSVSRDIVDSPTTIFPTPTQALGQAARPE